MEIAEQSDHETGARRAWGAHRVIASALAAARRRSRLGDFIGVLELYCENPDCAVRELSMRVKEDGAETPSTLHCPACRRPPRILSALTRDEAAENLRREARCSVNVELYRARERRRLGLRKRQPVPVPISVLLDDRLPEVRA